MRVAVMREGHDYAHEYQPINPIPGGVFRARLIPYSHSTEISQDVFQHFLLVLSI